MAAVAHLANYRHLEERPQIPVFMAGAKPETCRRSDERAPAVLAEQRGSGIAAAVRLLWDGHMGTVWARSHRRRSTTSSGPVSSPEPFLGRLGAPGMMPGPEHFSARLGEFWPCGRGAFSLPGSRPNLILGVGFGSA